MSKEDEVQIPQNSSYMDAKRQEVQRRFSTVLDEFKKLLGDKTHPDNQTAAYHKNIQGILGRMLSTAEEVDQQTPGGGLWALFAVSLRSHLRLKDELTKQEVRIRDMEREIKQLKQRG
jgi:hypothetical protein